MTNSSFSPEVEQQLIEKFDLLLQSLNTFKQALDFETETIKTKPASELISSSEQKQIALSELEKATANISVQIKPLRIERLLEEPSHYSNNLELLNLIKRCSERTVECHDQNLSNGMSIQILSNINNQMLHMMKGDPNDVKLYGSKGSKQPQALGKTTLGKA